MNFERKLDSTYPNVYETWKTDDSTWIIQDLPPEDDEDAIKILVEYQCPEETLCSVQKVTDDPVSLGDMCEFWRQCLTQRMSIGCYVEKHGVRKLAGLNVCAVGHKDDEDKADPKGEKSRNIYAAIKYIESKINPYEYMGLDSILHAMGLVVKKEFRGASLGSKILAARQPLALSQGVKGTATLFTGTSSQKLAIKSGFITVLEIPIRELADAGLPYPRDDSRILKYMIKKFV